MAQRAALARALVHRPRLVLLDEPFGALDSLTRASLQEELFRLHQAEKRMMLLVTHDLEEAVFLADRVLVLSSRPAFIRAAVRIDLPRPRDRMSPGFAAAKSVVYEIFRGQPSCRSGGEVARRDAGRDFG